jgi:hypothetical protein
LTAAGSAAGCFGCLQSAEMQVVVAGLVPGASLTDANDTITALDERRPAATARVAP